MEGTSTPAPVAPPGAGSSSSRGAQPDRAEALARLHAAGRDQSNAAVMFHSALAAQVGLGAVEEKALDLLQRDGPLSPGELARRTGLAPASVTGLLDRLQGRGFVSRVRDPRDGRRLLVQVDDERLSDIAALFEDLSRRLDEFYAGLSVAELVQAAQFLTGVTAVQRAATDSLSESSPGASRESTVVQDGGVRQSGAS